MYNNKYIYEDISFYIIWQYINFDLICVAKMHFSVLIHENKMGACPQNLLALSIYCMLLSCTGFPIKPPNQILRSLITSRSQIKNNTPNSNITFGIITTQGNSPVESDELYKCLFLTLKRKIITKLVFNFLLIREKATPSPFLFFNISG